jgi:3-phenylpropionate/trans-cinnamate dioxygenase ferredoxin reductase component
VLVVGAGLAGLRTVAELRSQGFEGEITVVGAETTPPYDRPPLSKELFTRTQPVWLAGEGYGELGELADRVLLGHRGLRLDAADGGARLEVEPVTGGGTVALEADAVVLAVGAHAVTPPGWSGAVLLHEADDAERLRSLLQPGRRLVVVGAGWIGAEVAGLAASQGCEVQVVEAAPTPLARQVGTRVGALTVPWYAAAGVELRCDAPVGAVRPGEVRLADGEILRADVVLAATGVRPATGWLAGAVPLTPRGAVPVDEAGSVIGGPASVRAVGDCADMTVSGVGTVPGGHWDAALTHPAAVVAGLLGHDAPPTPAPYVFSTQLGHELTLVGRPHDGEEIVLRRDPAGGGWTALYLTREAYLPTDPAAGPARLVGGFTVDRPRDVGPLRKLLAGGSRPVLDLDRALDTAVPLRRAVVPAG